MRWKLRPVAAGVVWLGFVGLLGGCISYHEEYRIERDIAKTFRTDDLKLLEVDLVAGELLILQGGAGVVRVDGTIRVRGRSAERLEEYVDSLELEEMGNGEYRLGLRSPRSHLRYDIELGIGEGRRYGRRGPRARYRFENDLTITVPPSADLDVRLKYGTVGADMVLPRSARFRMRAGEVKIRLPSDASARVSLRAKVGDVSMGGFERMEGSVHRKALVGARYTGRIGDAAEADDRSLELSVGAGEVSVRGH